MRMPTSYVVTAVLSSWALATAACSGGGSRSGQKGDPGVPPEERDALRACVLGRLPAGDVSGYDLVQVFGECRPATDAAADARAFRATMDGFAAPVDGNPVLYRIAR